MSASPGPSPSPTLVALVGWLVPGAGYLLLGQRSRALTVGITIVVLFVLGLLVGGVRSLEVPGWDDDGYPIRLNGEGYKVRSDELAYAHATWVMRQNPLSEIRGKPWSIAQVLNGPMAVAAGAWSIRAATEPGGPGGAHAAPGVTSHARVNEIGVLYTAVAGMLNLLAIIDASHRAALPPEAR